MSAGGVRVGVRERLEGEVYIPVAVGVKMKVEYRYEFGVV
jgi:hypothetical protein